MRRLVLSFLCLMAAFGLFGQTERELTQNKENYLTKRNEVWFDYFSNISIYKDCPAVEQICRELLGISGQQSLKEFVEGRIQTYDTKIPYSSSKFEELKHQGFVGHDYMIVRPKGKPVGNCQPFEIVRTYQDEGMEKKSIMLWTFLYDQKNDKVLTVDDVFVPEKAAELKEKAGEDYISLFAKDGKIYFGSTIANDYIMYNTLQFIQDADKLTDQFKQAVAFDSLDASGNTSSKEDTICGKPEIYPQFPGGDAALFEWLRKHLKYPQKCQEMGIKGTVITRFVLEKDGSIGEIEIVQSPHPDLSQEAVRVIKAMPKWTPAMVDGKPVRARFNLPITFRLNDSPKGKKRKH